MKRFWPLLFLLFVAPALAVNTIREDNFRIAAIVAMNIKMHCDCTVTTNADGTQSMIIRNVLLRWKINSPNDGLMEYCSRTSNFDFFINIVTDTLSIYDAVTKAKGKLWVWETGQTMPVEADPWCLQ